MIVLEFNEVEIDHCLACGGVWLDEGELELIIANSTVYQFETTGKKPKRPLKCPMCAKKMKAVFWKTNDSILLDQCPKGHGLWFDQGELRKTIRNIDQSSTQVEILLSETFKDL
jgi:Zn-finger nucleic acid-binding protein